MKHWGDWPTCKTLLEKGHARSIVDYLVHHPQDFRGACERLKPELRGLYLSVYQSDLWNRTLSAWLIANLASADLTGIKLRLGIHAVPKQMPETFLADWKNGSLPLLSARLKTGSIVETSQENNSENTEKVLPNQSETWLPFAEKVLQEEGLTLSELRIKGMDKPFFSKGDRAMCLQPTSMKLESEPDERHKGRQKLIAQFELPRGSYATMIVKRLTATEPLKKEQSNAVNRNKESL